MPIPNTSVAFSALAALLLASSACSRQDTAVRDTAGGEVILPSATVGRDSSGAPDRAAAAAAPAPVSPGGVATDSDYLAVVVARYGPPRDDDQAFLRMMADHHEGLIVIAAPVLDQAVSGGVTSDARALRAAQERELRDMLGLLQRKYGESYEPEVLPSNRLMVDSLGRATGAAFDTLFYRQVVAHHRQGLAMMDDYVPKLKDPQVKAMAEKMRAEHARQSDELEQKL